MTEETPGRMRFFQWCFRNPVEVMGAILLILLTVLVFLQMAYCVQSTC